MKPASQTDTIAALSTPVGEGGISVIRISGSQACLVADMGFRGKARLGDVQTHTAHFGHFVGADANQIDDIVAVIFKAPNSYTGEDTVELSCHGGVHVTRRVVESLIEYGARQAEPGEFTKRAFLNGKLDLSQAEAVADLIHARSDAAHRASLSQLRGSLSVRIQDLRNQLIESISLLELELDFAEDGYEFVDKSKVSHQVRTAINEVDDLMTTYRKGRIYKEGVKVVLTGPPNVGKSSLLNALLNEDRAIVTDIPGTTRDVIEEAINIDGIAFRIVDTAGLRKTDDLVEKEGVRRTEDQAQTSDIVVLVVDGSTEVTPEDRNAILSLLTAKPLTSAIKLVAINKIDLVPRANGELAKRVDFLSAYPVVRISALTGEGILPLKELLSTNAVTGQKTSQDNSVTVTTARHFDALRRTSESLSLAVQSLDANQSGEFMAIDLRRALDALGEITGEVTTDEILDNIFSRFCIGK